MQKLYLLLTFSFTFFLFSLHAMEETPPEEMNKNIINIDQNSLNKILKINDPVKFNLLARQFVMKNHPDSKTEFQIVTNEEKLKSLQDSMSKIVGLNTGLLEELDELSDQSVQKCNEARQRGVLYASTWFLSTGILLAMEGYLLFQELSNEAKVMSGIPLFAAAYGTITKFFDDANKIVNNTHINEQIEKHTAKIETLSKIKCGIEKDIKSLTKKINLEHKNKSLYNMQKNYADSSG